MTNDVLYKVYDEGFLKRYFASLTMEGAIEGIGIESADGGFDLIIKKNDRDIRNFSSMIELINSLPDIKNGCLELTLDDRHLFCAPIAPGLFLKISSTGAVIGEFIRHKTSELTRMLHARSGSFPSDKNGLLPTNPFPVFSETELQNLFRFTQGIYKENT